MSDRETPGQDDQVDECSNCGGTGTFYDSKGRWCICGACTGVLNRSRVTERHRGILLMSDRETPGQDEQFDGWRVRWTSRRRRNYQRGELHEPVLVLTKEGRMWVEVKGQTEIDRPVMLAHGMVSAMICDAHFAREWGDDGAALLFELKAEDWRQIVKIRTIGDAVQRVGARMAVSPAGAGAKGRRV